MHEAEAPEPGDYSTANRPAGGSPGENFQDEGFDDDGSSTAAFAPLTATLLARKGEAEPAHEPYSKARVGEGAREMAPGARHNIDDTKTANAKRQGPASTVPRAGVPAAPRAGMIGPVIPETDGGYTDNPFQYAASQGLKDIIERAAPVERDAPFRPSEPIDRAPPPALVGHSQPTQIEPRPEPSATPIQRPNQIAPPRPALQTAPARDGGFVHPAPALETPALEEAPVVPVVNEIVQASAPEPKTTPEPKTQATQSAVRYCPAEPPAPRRAAVTFRMSTRDYLRMKLASAELETSCQDLLLSALEEYLDALGVERLDQCACLAKAAGACEAAAVKPR